jgi:hypothetical protein
VFCKYNKASLNLLYLQNNATSTLGECEYLISAGRRTRTMESVSLRDPGLKLVGFVTKVNWPVKDN